MTPLPPPAGTPRVPPRWMRAVDWMLRHAIPRHRSHEILADLHERRARRLSRAATRHTAGRWYLKNAFSLLFHYGVLRMTATPPRHDAGSDAPLGLTERIGAVLADLRYATRGLARRPAFACVVVLTLALGIGANVAVFTLVRNVVLRPPPYPEPERLVALWMEFRHEPGRAGFEIVASEPEYVEFREATTSFAGLAGYWTQRVNLMGEDEPVRVRSAAVSANVLEVLGIAPAMGRDFLPGEDQPGGPAVVILSDGLWSRAFGRDSGVVGRRIIANGESFEVVGVMPAGFQFPSPDMDVDMLRLNSIDPANLAGRSSHYLRLVGRLRPEVSLREAQAEAAVAIERLGEANAGRHGIGPTHPMRMVSLQARRSGPHRPALWLLSGAALLVLLIACANVANLMYARSESRSRELAIRGALGAGRGRLVGHLLVEALLLSGIGCAVALGLATLLLPRLLAVGGGGLLPPGAWRIDLPVGAFSLGVALLSALGFALAPTLGATRGPRADALKDGRGWGDPRRTRVRNGLLLTQLTVAVLLLIGAGVLTRNLAALLRVDPGFDPDGVVAMTFYLDEARYPDIGVLADFHRRLDERLAALPPVVASGAVRTLPLVSDGGQETVVASGVRDADPDGINAVYQVASPGYFRALSIPLVGGRLYDASDTRATPPVVVINQTMARRFWPDGDAIGNTIRMGPASVGNPVMQIVGVVGDVIQTDLGQGATPQFFVPRAQAVAYREMGTREATLVVKGSGTPSSLMATVRAAIRDLDPRIPVSDLRTMESVVSRSVAGERFLSRLMAAFAVVALALAAIGVYGLMAYLVAQRTRDIGLRMALGADRGRVIGGVVGRSVALALVGAALGVAGAVAGSRLLERFVVLVSARDPLIFAVGPLVLVATAALAAYAPARRAASVDPTQALRAD